MPLPMKLSSELVSTTMANIMIKDEKGENKGRLFCPHAVLRKLFQLLVPQDST